MSTNGLTGFNKTLQVMNHVVCLHPQDPVIPRQRIMVVVVVVVVDGVILLNSHMMAVMMRALVVVVVKT